MYLELTPNRKKQMPLRVIDDYNLVKYHDKLGNLILSRYGLYIEKSMTSFEPIEKMILLQTVKKLIYVSVTNVIQLLMLLLKRAKM